MKFISGWQNSKDMKRSRVQYAEVVTVLDAAQMLTQRKLVHGPSRRGTLRGHLRLHNAAPPRPMAVIGIHLHGPWLRRGSLSGQRGQSDYIHLPHMDAERPQWGRLAPIPLRNNVRRKKESICEDLFYLKKAMSVVRIHLPSQGSVVAL